MARSFTLFAAALVLLAAGTAEAGRPRGGTVMTPFGPAYNTNSPEWRMSGGNPLLYQQIMEQKMLMQQQQFMIKMQQQAAKTKNLTPSNSTPRQLPTFTRPRKKKHRTYVPTGPAAKPAATATGTPPAAGTDKAASPAAPAAKP